MTSHDSPAIPTASDPAAVAAKTGPAHKHPHPPRAPRPNYRHIHRFPLPLSVHPLPPLIPHNPLSVISVLLSYLTYFIAPPQHEVYSAYFDSATSSVHVTDEKTIRALWEMGFFGKGTLSRSEPSWLDREKKRRGLLRGVTSEEVTRQRRTERRELKLERARMEKVAIDQRLLAEAAAREGPVGQSSLPVSAAGATNGIAPAAEKFSLKKAREAKLLESRRSGVRESSDPTLQAAEERALDDAKPVQFLPKVQTHESSDTTTLNQATSLSNGHITEGQPILKNEEHLQLSSEEAFFLVYGLGALQIIDPKEKTSLSSKSLLSLFCHHSYSPVRDLSASLETDDPFLVSYVVYHHFRSLGWVVRSGVKFGVDYIIYNRGPVFSHAEFAVVVLPSYDHPYWSETEERRAHCASKQARSWWWLHCVNRVQAQVKKTLVVCYVEIPPPKLESSDSTTESQDIGALLGRYKVRDVVIKRWVPNRTRD